LLVGDWLRSAKSELEHTLVEPTFDWAGGMSMNEFDHWSIVLLDKSHESDHSSMATDGAEALEEVRSNTPALPVVTDDEVQLCSLAGRINTIVADRNDLLSGAAVVDSYQRHFPNEVRAGYNSDFAREEPVAHMEKAAANGLFRELVKGLPQEVLVCGTNRTNEESIAFFTLHARRKFRQLGHAGGKYGHLIGRNEVAPPCLAHQLFTKVGMGDMDEGESAFSDTLPV
jgi:hypothetical protein